MRESAVTTVLVVGCGYIGLPFAWQAKRAGKSVRVTSRSPERMVRLKEAGFTSIPWDVTAPESSLPEVDAVVYAVGFDRSSGKSVDEVYVQGLRNTLERLPGSPKFVYASSTGVYGEAGGGWVDETALVQTQDSTAEACRQAEQFLSTSNLVKDRNYCILRFAGLYGYGRLINAEPLKRGEPVPGDGAAWLNLVHQDDAAEALWKAVLNGEPGEIYNIADGHPVRRQDYYLKLAELLKAPLPTFAPELARRQRGNRRVNAEKARWKLGWSPRYPSYVEGLEAAVKLMTGEQGA
jgi:nucleoside-diphosphate-sugar epimerase